MDVYHIAFHAAYNYGAVLQCMALHKILLSLGHKPTVIDYSPAYIHKLYRKWRWHPRLVVSPLTFTNMIKGVGFRRFVRENLQLTQECYYRASDLADLRPKADAYIAGSDQIWNWAVTSNRPDPALYLDFAPANAMRIAYAASFGGQFPPKMHEAAVAKYLARFTHISCRERSGTDYVRQMGFKAETTLDPTLLLGENEMIPVKRSGAPAKPKIFVYAIEPSPLLHHALRTSRRYYGHPAYIVDGTWKFWEQRGISHFPSPERWLHELRASSCVLGNSFHGIAFALLFRRPFVYIPLSERFSQRNERVVDLLKRLGLLNRIAPPEMSGDIRSILCSTIDWDDVTQRLDNLRRHSIKFLRTALSRA